MANLRVVAGLILHGAEACVVGLKTVINERYLTLIHVQVIQQDVLQVIHVDSRVFSYQNSKLLFREWLAA